MEIPDRWSWKENNRNELLICSYLFAKSQQFWITAPNQLQLYSIMLSGSILDQATEISSQQANVSRSLKRETDQGEI